MDSPSYDDDPRTTVRRSPGFGRVLANAVLSGIILAGVLWAVSRYLFKDKRDDYRLYVWVAIGAIVSRLLTWPLTGRRVPGILVEIVSIVLFAIIVFGGYSYVWPGVRLQLA